MGNSVFISYSHADERWLKRLNVHLAHTVRTMGIEVWHDKKIAPGARWLDEINTALAATKVAVLLVSADFLSSDFIDKNELPPLLNAASGRGGLVVLPVIVGASRFRDVPWLSAYQAVNDPTRPLEAMTDAEVNAVLVDVARAVEAAMLGKPAAVHRMEAQLDDTTEDVTADADEGDEATLADALAQDIASVLEDEDVSGMVVSAVAGGDVATVLTLVVTEDGELGMEICGNKELPEPLRLSAAARKVLKEDYEFEPTGDPSGSFVLVFGPLDEVDPDAVLGCVSGVLEDVFELPREDIEIDWELVRD